MALYHSRVYRADKNHNPRKGTDKKSSLIFVFSFFVENFDEVSPHTRDFSHELGGT